MIDRVPRRKLLAGLASASAITTAGLVLTTERSRTFTHTKPIQTSSIGGLVVDWRETYNGRTLVDTSDGTASHSPTGPVISLGNILPGDTGSLSVRLRLETDEADLEIEPSVAFELTGERSSPGLQEFVDVAVWYDVGLFGIDSLGSHNGEHDVGERLVAPAAEGSLEDVAAALADGVSLDGSPGIPATSCLAAGDDGVTITVGWSFPPEQPNINAVQGDAVEFDLTFDATHC